MKILSLKSENIKRLKAVEIAPGGSHVAVVGRNEQGKSSVLDSIMYALAGKGEVCERPIRDGQSNAKIVIELDAYTVTRTFTAAGGGMLKVVAKDGKISSPQAILDGLVGDLSFDPFEFTRAKNQAEVLRKLVGLDTSALEAEHDKVYFDRTEVNRQTSVLAGKINSQHSNDLLPDKEIDVRDILTARAEAAKQNDRNLELRNNYNSIVFAIQQTNREMVAELVNVQRLERELAAAKAKHALLSTQHEVLQDQQKEAGAVTVPPNVDLSGYDQQILNAQKTNADIRANRELRAHENMRNTLVNQSVDLTRRLDAIEDEIDKKLASVKYPIVGLGFSSTGTVTFDGIPFSQLSTAQRLKISAAIGIALNPKLRVMFIRDGSVMDEDTLTALVQIAEVHDTQLWIERVGKSLDGELPGVIIEDGSVIASTLPQFPEAKDSNNTACV